MRVSWEVSNPVPSNLVIQPGYEQDRWQQDEVRNEKSQRICDRPTCWRPTCWVDVQFDDQNHKEGPHAQRTLMPGVCNIGKVITVEVKVIYSMTVPERPKQVLVYGNLVLWG